MKPSDREYTGATQYFHNYEHDIDGLTHCRGPELNPYRIVHYKGKNIINVKYAKGHGKRRDGQWFEFTERYGPGWELSSGVKIDPDDIPAGGKLKTYFKIEDNQLMKSKLGHDTVRDKLKNLKPIKLREAVRLVNSR